MALKKEGAFSYAVICDDPYHRKCQDKVGPYISQGRAVRIAEENKWYISEATNRHSCPTCLGLHHEVLERRVSSGKMTKEEADESGDPFTAAFIAMAFGGDPLMAGLTTLFTGSTPLGVIVGIMTGDRDTYSEEKSFQGGGGNFGGAGATASFDNLQTGQAPSDASEVASEDIQQKPPVIIDPFESETKPAEPDSSQPEVKSESETFQSLETQRSEQSSAETPQVENSDSSVSVVDVSTDQGISY